jgi:hypothetical protein
MDHFAQWVLGLLLIVGGLGYVAVRILEAFGGDPDQGWWGGWFAVLCGLGVAVLGILVIVF